MKEQYNNLPLVSPVPDFDEIARENLEPLVIDYNLQCEEFFQKLSKK